MKLNFLSGILGKKGDNTALGVDIGSSSIKIVQVSKKGDRIILDTYGELSFAPYGNGNVGEAAHLEMVKISEALTALLTEKDVGVTAKTAGFAIPFESSLMTTFRLPSVATKDMQTVVPIEARKYIPVPMSEVALDWTVIPPDTDIVDEKDDKNHVPDGTEVLLVAIHNDILSEYQSIADASKLGVQFFEIEIFSTIRAIVEEEEKPVLIIDMGAMNTKLYILERGVIRASHTINTGAQDLTRAIVKKLNVDFTQAEVLKREVGLGTTENGTDLRVIVEEPLETIFNLASRISSNFAQKHGQAIKRGYLVGGGAALKGIDAYATEILRTPTEMGNPFKKLETPAFIDEVLAKTGPEFVVAVGSAIRAVSEKS